MDLKEKIRAVQDFPKKGISFKDITPLLLDNEAMKQTIDEIVENLRERKIDVVVGPEARGFLFGILAAYELGVGFVPIRKPGKLPYDTFSVEYDLEYGTDKLEIHKDAIKPGQRVAIVDDILATGGTVVAVTKMVEQMGGEVASLNFVVELTDLKGSEKLKDYDVQSLIKYDI